MPRNFDDPRIQRCEALYGFNHDALAIDTARASRYVGVSIRQDENLDGESINEGTSDILDPRRSRFEDD